MAAIQPIDMAVLRQTVVDLIETVAVLSIAVGHVGVLDGKPGSPGVGERLRLHLTELQARAEELQANNAFALLANAHGTIRNVPHVARFVEK